MWVRKTDRDLKVDRLATRFSPLPAFVVAVLAGFCAFLEYVGGIRLMHGGGSAPPAAPDIAALRASEFSVLIFVLAYVVQLLFPGWYRSRSHEAFICGSCGTVQVAGDANTCVCGGRLEPLREWTWIENATPTPNQAIQRTAPRSDA